MNSFLSRWSSNCVEPSRLLFIMKKSGCMNNTARSVFDNVVNTSSRSISVTSRLQLSFVYKVTVKTGDKFGAGTDSNVYLRMIGALGSTDEIMLKATKEELERGRIDHYNIASDDVGPLKKIIIRHDNSGFAPGWYLDWVSIRDGKGMKYNFKCDNWLVKGETYGNIKLLKEDNYVDSPDDANEINQTEEKFGSKGEIHDLVENTKANEQILEDLKDLEVLSQSASETEKIVSDESEPSAAQEHQSSTKHATSLSPAVRNLLDTYDIDMFKVSPSGPHSRILKGDVLAYITKENITRKNFVVNMIHPVEVKQKAIATAKPILKMEDNYMDHVASESEQLVAQELRLGKFEIPHLYMSINCPISKLVSSTASLEQDFYDFARNILFVRIFCRALLETFDALNDNDGAMDMLVSNNGSSIILRNCNDADVQNIYQQYKQLGGSVDDVLIPRYGLNIVDAEGVSQLSSVLRVGQIISLNVGGTQLGVDLHGKLTKSINVAISCDSRVISEVTCALLLVNCKKYITNPDLLGL